MYVNTYIRVLDIPYAASQVYDHWSQNVMLILQFAPQIGYVLLYAQSYRILVTVSTVIKLRYQSFKPLIIF